MKKTPPTTKIQKENIIEAAYEIVKKEGMEGINARAIAKKLNCSVQPIFHKFSNMEELKKELVQKVLQTYRKYMTVDSKSPFPYKEIGINYIKFAKEEPQLFRIIFMSQSNLTPESFITYDESYIDISKYAENATGIASKEDVNSFHLKMWTFTHGIATMIATKTCDFTDEQINKLLTDEFKALMLLEKMKGENR